MGPLRVITEQLHSVTVIAALIIDFRDVIQVPSEQDKLQSAQLSSFSIISIS